MVDDSVMYAEVYDILSCMNKKEVMRIPLNIINLIKQEKSKTYKTKVNKNDLFNPDNVDQRTINLLTWLMINYMADEDEKNKFIKLGKENDRQSELMKAQKYSINVFENEKTVKIESIVIEDIIVDDADSNDKKLIVSKKRTIFDEIINVFKSIFMNRGKNG